MFAALSLLTWPVLGCGGDAPDRPQLDTQPVSGTVTTVDGQPVRGGVVQFQLTTDNRMTALGEVGEDGTFTLETRFEGTTFSGAVTGEHLATYLPPMDEDQGGEPVELAEPYTVVSGDNAIAIDLTGRRR